MEQQILIAIIGFASGIAGSILTILGRGYLERCKHIRDKHQTNLAAERTILVEASAIVQKIKDAIRYEIDIDDPGRSMKVLRVLSQELFDFYIQNHAKLSTVSVRNALHTLKENIAQKQTLAPARLQDLLQQAIAVHSDILAELVATVPSGRGRKADRSENVS